MSVFSQDGVLVLMDGAAQGASPSTLQQVVLFGSIALIMYLFIFLPQSRERKAKEALVASIAKDDKVVTLSGLHGRVTSVAEHTVEVEIAPNTRVTMDKAAISRKGDAPVSAK
ncbi:MAG: preprotein translocase subunit YajC [Deltaproteobacteria bacterium]|nr:preprotein translocase subunit YajC [Deltaproteobacteria bacterium]